MIEMSGIELVERIDDLLKNKGLNRPAMAEELGFSVSNIAHWKRRNSLPDAQTIYAMSKYLNVSVSYLLTGNNDSDLSSDVYLMAKKIQLLSEIDKATVSTLIEHLLAAKK